MRHHRLGATPEPDLTLGGARCDALRRPRVIRACCSRLQSIAAPLTPRLKTAATTEVWSPLVRVAPVSGLVVVTVRLMELVGVTLMYKMGNIRGY